MTEKEWIQEDPDAVVDQYFDEGLREAVSYNLEVAWEVLEENITSAWSTKGLENAILKAAHEQGRLRPEDKARYHRG